MSARCEQHTPSSTQGSAWLARRLSPIGHLSIPKVIMWEERDQRPVSTKVGSNERAQCNPKRQMQGRR